MAGLLRFTTNNESTSTTSLRWYYPKKSKENRMHKSMSRKGAFRIVTVNAENLARLCEGEARSNPVKKHCITGLPHFVRKDASAEFATI
jgi:hypothetical protein